MDCAWQGYHGHECVCMVSGVEGQEAISKPQNVELWQLPGFFYTAGTWMLPKWWQQCQNIDGATLGKLNSIAVADFAFNVKSPGQPWTTFVSRHLSRDLLPPLTFFSGVLCKTNRTEKSKVRCSRSEPVFKKLGFILFFFVKRQCVVVQSSWWISLIQCIFSEMHSSS